MGKIIVYWVPLVYTKKIEGGSYVTMQKKSEGGVLAIALLQGFLRKQDWVELTLGWLKMEKNHSLLGATCVHKKIQGGSYVTMRKQSEGGVLAIASYQSVRSA